MTKNKSFKKNSNKMIITLKINKRKWLEIQKNSINQKKNNKNKNYKLLIILKKNKN